MAGEAREAGDTSSKGGGDSCQPDPRVQRSLRLKGCQPWNLNTFFLQKLSTTNINLISNINLIGQSTVQNKWKPSAINSTANGIRPRSSVPTANGIRPHSGIYHLMISRDIILILISSDMSGRRSGMIPFVHFA
jgi:hypothetical protein